MTSLAGKCALVTGSTQGLGLAGKQPTGRLAARDGVAAIPIDGGWSAM